MQEKDSDQKSYLFECSGKLWDKSKKLMDKAIESILSTSEVCDMVSKVMALLGFVRSR